MTELADGINWLSAKAMIQLRQQARSLPLARGKIHARQGGAYMSSFKGRGMEYDESRLYLPGDDIRNMDWRVTARTGDAHTKVFREERERPVLIWLDLGPSMMFATRHAYKSVVASEIAALLAWSAANHNDRLGGLVFAGDAHTEIRPRRGKQAVLDLFGRIARHPAWQGSTTANDMQASLRRLRKVARPGSLVFMISDFRDFDDRAEKQLASISRHNDVILIPVSDPLEADLPERGQYRISDGKRRLLLDAGNRAFRQRYRQRYQQRQQRLAQHCRQHRNYLMPVSTSDNVLAKLQQGLGIRASLQSQFRSA